MVKLSTLAFSAFHLLVRFDYYQRAIISLNIINSCGSGSSVGIATDYGLDGPGSNPGGDELFPPSRPALGSFSGVEAAVEWG